MQAKDIMTTKVVTIAVDGTVEGAVGLMLDNHVSALPVVDAEGGLVGLISEGDLMRRASEQDEPRKPWWLKVFAGANETQSEFVKLRSRHVADVMTREVVSVDEDTPVGDIARLLEKHRIKRVPVMSGGRLTGIVSRANLLHALSLVKPGGLPEPSKDDRDLRARIDTALKEIPDTATNRLNYTVVNYTVEDGKVTMSGLAESEMEENAIRVAVENVQGVRSVESHLGRLPAWVYYGI